MLFLSMPRERFSRRYFKVSDSALNIKYMYRQSVSIQINYIVATIVLTTVSDMTLGLVARLKH